MLEIRGAASKVPGEKKDLVPPLVINREGWLFFFQFYMLGCSIRFYMGEKKTFLWFKKQFENHFFREFFLIVYRVKGLEEKKNYYYYFFFLTEVFLNIQNKNFKCCPSQVLETSRPGTLPVDPGSWTHSPLHLPFSPHQVVSSARCPLQAKYIGNSNMWPTWVIFSFRKRN